MGFCTRYCSRLAYHHLCPLFCGRGHPFGIGNGHHPHDPASEDFQLPAIHHPGCFGKCGQNHHFYRFDRRICLCDGIFHRLVQPQYCGTGIIPVAGHGRISVRIHSDGHLQLADTVTVFFQTDQTNHCLAVRHIDFCEYRYVV